MQRELAHRKAAKKQDRIIRELLTAKKHLRNEVREVLHAAKADQVESQFQDYHRRRGLQLAELNVSTVTYWQ